MLVAGDGFDRATRLFASADRHKDPVDAGRCGIAVTGVLIATPLNFSTVPYFLAYPGTLRLRAARLCSADDGAHRDIGRSLVFLDDSSIFNYLLGKVIFSARFPQIF